MTLRDYYRKAARLQRAYERFDRRTRVRLSIASRLAQVIIDFDSSKRYRVAYKRWEKMRTLAAERLLPALTARKEARDRMYFDPQEHARTLRREEFARRNRS